MYVNKAIIVGNITRDPELKSLPSGQSVCTFSVATNKVYTDRDGKRQETVEYHNIVAWGKTGENIATYMRKGSQLYIEGELQTRSWDDKDSGKKMYRTEIVAHNVQFGHNPNAKKQNQEVDEFGDPIPPRSNRSNESAVPEYPEEEINPEDIPF